MGASHLVSRRVGSRRASDFYLLNQTWGAAAALEHGLLSMVVADHELPARTEEVVERFAVGPTAALAATKELLRGTWHRSFETQLEEEARAITLLAGTSGAREGLAALAERRTPCFEGAGGGPASSTDTRAATR